ncbi:MAG: acetamidase/formamidase family protein [Alphaproteobacteria bacterium]|nr:acetamidase/formamidase family protein [Alphaproteobacteria bacterium]
MPDTVTIKRSGAVAKDDPCCFNRLHYALSPVARVKPGDYLVFETRDALDHQFSFSTTNAEVAKADLTRVHPMTGPVHVAGAERGDALAVTIVDIAPDVYGYTCIIPGFGFLRDLFTQPYIANWRLDRLAAVSPQVPGVRIPIAAFPGSIGVLPGEPEVKKALAREGALAAAGGMVLMPEPTNALPADLFGPSGRFKGEALRTVPPRENGGNMDIKEMQVGTTILFPVLVEGAGLWTGDVHFAQGDGEVTGTAIEMDATVTVQCEVIKGGGKNLRYPHFKGGAQLKQTEPTQFYAATGLPLKKAGELPPQMAWLDSPKLKALENVAEDLTLATRDALINIIEYMVAERGLTREQAYTVAAVAVDLRIGQLVDVPNFMVSAILPLNIFER